VEFLPSVGIEPFTLGFKYMFNASSLPTRAVTDKELELLKSLGRASINSACKQA
jgi:hypothetical protein